MEVSSRSQRSPSLPAPRLQTSKASTLPAPPTPSPNTAASSSSWNGPTRAVPMTASTTSAAAWRLSSASGPPKVSSGSPSYPPRLANRATSPQPKRNTYLKTIHASLTAALLDPNGTIASPLRGQDHTPHLHHRPHRQTHLPRRNRRQAHHRTRRPQGRTQLPQRNSNRRHGRQAIAGREHPPLRLLRQILALTK